jgi:hypothetical protein
MAKARSSTTGRYIEKMRTLADSVAKRNRKIHAHAPTGGSARKSKSSR